MKWFVTFMVVILALGPFRRSMARAWRMTVPALVAGYGSWLALSTVLGPQEWWVMWFVPPLVALGAGAAFKEWLDGVLGRGK